ncbi:MAG: hypothetical protein ABR604_02140 [Jatrophihabitantaceae bacterium]
MTEHFSFAGDSTNDDGTNQAGPFVAEALRMVSAMQDWVQGWAQRGGDEPRAEHTGKDCQWCPLCQFLAVLRGQRPEVTDRVAEAGTALTVALRAFVEAASGAAGPHRASRPPSGPRVQKINLGDET